MNFLKKKKIAIKESHVEKIRMVIWRLLVIGTQ